MNDVSQILNAIEQGDPCAASDPRRAAASGQLQQCRRWAELEKNLPDILSGKRAPAAAAEWNEYARFCKETQRYEASARLYVQAFAADPKLAADLPASHRYAAAGSAARAGSGQGRDASKLDQDRARWRRQALTWLRAELAQRRTQLQSDKPVDRAAAIQKLRHWQRDNDLVCLRDKDSLAKLPAAERQACEKLWADVQTLLQQTQPG
jgi:hypothetical protein